MKKNQIILTILYFSYESIGLALSVKPWPSKITVFTGESKILLFPPNSDLTVSRKNVVNAKHLGNGEWMFTGLKPGRVLIEENSPIGNMTVLTVKKPVKSKRHNIFDKGSPYAYICQKRGVTCFPRSRTIKGVVDTWATVYRIKKICRQVESCESQVRLSLQGKNSFKAYLKTNLPQCQINLSSDSARVTIFCPCRNNKTSLTEQIDFLTNQGIKHRFVHMSCQHLLPKPYILKLNFTSSCSLDNLEKGLTTKKTILSRIPRFKMSEQKWRTKVNGQPVVRIQTGETGQLRAGLRIENSSNNYQRLSLEAKFRIRPSRTKTLTVEVTIKLTSRTNKNPLPENLLKTVVQLKEGQNKLIGNFDTQATIDSKDGIPFLNKIPILGPMTNLIADKTTMSKIEIGLELHADLGEPLLSQGNGIAGTNVMSAVH